MGVVGMTGVPIAQAASIGRPATWGHFILPLRQALSWQWQLPFFGCLFALLWLLNSLRADRPIANLALALTFCTAPYAAAWSNWPLYATLFPALLLALLHKLATSSKTVPRLILGALAGLVLTGWVLVLYPPWQITVGTFCGLLTVGWWLDQQAPIRRRVSLILALLAGALICALLLGSWWIDTRDGVAQIRSTVYPGARDALQGGELGHLWALRGYINAESLTFGTGPWANTSETSSYFVLPVIMLWLGFWYSSRRFALCWTARACLAFIGFWMIFRFVGIPMWLAKLTLWSNVPSGRLDLSLGLACTVLIAVVGQRQASESATEIPGNWWSALILSVASTGLIVYGALSFPKEIFPAISVPFIVAVAAAGFFMSWWLLRGRTDAAIGLCLLLSIISSVGFNPIHRAPQTVEMTEATSRFTLDKRTGEPFRTLTIGGGSMSAMTLAAVGVPVVNGTLYYPHRSMWTALGLGAADWPKVNRYQHLAFELANIPQGVPYQIAHELDQVRISVDPRRFNFALTGAKRVIATGNDVSALRTSPTLQEIGTQDQWVWFAVNDNRLE
jgi:hypothetical protein